MSRRSRTEYSLMNMSTSFIGYGLNIVLSFVCRMIFVRCLSEEYLGISGLFTNIISVLSLSELGIGTAIVYALYKPIADNNEKKIASLMNFYGKAYKIVGFFIFIVGLMCVPFLDFIIKEPPNIKENIKVIYILYLFSTASSYFFSYRSSIITANQKNYIVQGISYIVVIIQNVFQIAVLLITKNFMAYLIIQVVCVYITNVFISYKAKKDYPYIDAKNIEPLPKEEVWELIKNIKALTITKLCGILVNNTDSIVITYFNGLVTTGTSSNYTMLSTMLTTLVNQVFSSMAASIGNINVTENDETKFFFFDIINLANFWLYGWATIGIAVVSSDIVNLCFGSEYVLPISIPIVLAINFYIVGMQNAVWLYKSTLGLFKYGQYILLITAVINLIGDIIFGIKFGLFGIFLATVISRVTTNCWYDPYIVFKHGLHRNPISYFWSYLKHLAILLCTAICCFWACSFINYTPVLNVLIKVIICSIIPNTVFFLCFHRTDKFKYVYKRIKSLIGSLIKR